MIDASVAAKWYLPEPDSAMARRLLASDEALWSPDLIRIEVTAAIIRRFRTGAIGFDAALRACSAWQQAIDDEVILLAPSEADHKRAIGLALRIRHQFQDCLYLALAMRLSVPLVTADPRFAARAVGTYAEVRALGRSAN